MMLLRLRIASSQQKDRHTNRAPPTLQFVLVLDMQILADHNFVCSVTLIFGLFLYLLMQKRAPPTLQFVLVLDVQLLAD